MLKSSRRLQELFRAQGQSRIFIYTVFAIGIFYLVSDLKYTSDIKIDLEYEGKDKFIKRIIESLLEEGGYKAHNISFGRIGNRPKVHYAVKSDYSIRFASN